MLRMIFARLHRLGAASLLIAAWILAHGGPSSAAAAAAPYKGAIVLDAATGATLFTNNANAVSPPASMTKLMTYAVLVDLMHQGTIALDTSVTVTRDDAKVGMWADSTSVWLKQGEVFTVEELIYAMMIQSANDAAYCLAHKAGGSVEAFVALMNSKAQELGMTHSTFRTPHGFPYPSRKIAEGDLTSPSDFAMLCRHLVLHTDVLKYTSVKTRAFGSGQRMPPTQMRNHNHLLGQIDGVDGLKTGFTNGAGFCLSATAERNGHRVIVVMMDSPDSRTRDLNVRQLIEKGLAAIPVTEAPFAREGAGAGGVREVPATATAPGGRAAPTRPSPGSVHPVPDAAPPAGPVIHYPGL